jgi:hypothetical protein
VSCAQYFPCLWISLFSFDNICHWMIDKFCEKTLHHTSNYNIFNVGWRVYLQTVVSVSYLTQGVGITIQYFVLAIKCMHLKILHLASHSINHCCSLGAAANCLLPAREPSSYTRHLYTWAIGTFVSSRSTRGRHFRRGCFQKRKYVLFLTMWNPSRNYLNCLPFESTGFCGIRLV